MLQHGWLTNVQFVDCFAIVQVTPGPSTLVVTLLGYRTDGLAGAVAATAAMIVPAALVIGVVALFWLRSGYARWHLALEHGIALVAMGLVASSGIIIAAAVDRDATAWAVTAVAGLALSLTRMNPLAVVLLGGLAGLLLNGI